ncbi:tRNA-dihydrouridine(16/17) synthase [NAD(P)(+)]-like protein [Chamberlinius hualienensis]
MVDQSELAWRLLGRKYGAHLCYTPMLHASVFVKDARYRKENLVTTEEDRPLIVQFCANDPQLLLEAAKLVEGQCEAVDLNLGCPQAIAKKGHYGAYLQDEWELIYKMVNLVHTGSNVPITCKIRIFEDVSKTVEFAKMLEAAGCQLLCVHGRTREQKGPVTGVARWAHIRAVKQSVSIPVFSNGNIQNLNDVERCFHETGVDGVMIAEGSLHNPALFKGINPPVWQMAEEYLEIVDKHPCQLSFVRGHLFKLFYHCFQMDEFLDLRDILAKGGSVECFASVTARLKERILKTNDIDYNLTVTNSDSQKLLPWYCQPYVRPPPTSLNSKVCNSEETNLLNVDETKKRPKRCLDHLKDTGLSKKKMKQIMRNPHKEFKERKRDYQLCENCLNPKGVKCPYGLCRNCCREKCTRDALNCEGHRIQVNRAGGTSKQQNQTESQGQNIS